MTDLYNEDILRRIELIALVLEKEGCYTENDLMDYFGVSVQTIRRDAQMIRNMGIPLHSSKGVYSIFEKNIKTLNNLICTYLALNKHDTIKNLKLITDKFKNSTLYTFVKILKAINKKETIRILYKKPHCEEPQIREITPVRLIRTEKNIRLLAVEDDKPEILKIFLLERINKIDFTNKKTKIKNIPDADNIYRTVWDSFTGGEPEKVILKFDKEVGEYILDRIYIETQNIEEIKDGYLMSLEVRLSYEFISWVMGWGEMVEILEPEELKKEVIERARGILKKNKVK